MTETLPDDLETFADRVYWLVAQVPHGRVATYGQIASYAGSPRAPRAVGNLMRDSYANGVEVPWQRIINATGGISFKGDASRAMLQRELLELEGIVFDRRFKCEMKTFQWVPNRSFWLAEQH